MPARQLTDEELRNFSGLHLCYEMEMLFSFRNILVKAVSHATLEDKTRFLACLEAWTIHLRLLIDFLYASRGEPTDVVAADFVDDVKAWKRSRPKKDSALDIAVSRAGKQVAHLSYLRKEEDPWDVSGLTDKMHAVLTVFVEHASPVRLAPIFVEIFTRFGARPVDMAMFPPHASLDDLARLTAGRIIETPPRDARSESQTAISTTNVIPTPEPGI